MNIALWIVIVFAHNQRRGPLAIALAAITLGPIHAQLRGGRNGVPI